MVAEFISGSDLDSAVNAAKKTVVVMFCATWSSACRVTMPSFETAATSSSLPFYKFDVDTDQATSTKFGIRALPTVALYKGGQAWRQTTGIQTTDQIRALAASA